MADPKTLTQRELNRATLERQLLLTRRRLPLLRAIERIAGMQAQWPPAPYVGLWSRLPGFRRESLERAILGGQVVKATLMRSTLHLVSAVHGDLQPLAVLILPEIAEGAVVVDSAKHPDGVVHRIGSEREKRSRTRTGEVAHRDPGRRSVDPRVARTELLRRYLAAFGPATRADLADWSGMRVSDFATAFDALEPLRRFRNEDGKELLDLTRAPLPPADTPAPVRFLPKWDSVLLAFKDRTRVLPEEYRKVVIAKNGDVAQTFLVDGIVRGTWRIEKKRVLTDPFDPLPRAARAEFEEEARRLEAFVA